MEQYDVQELLVEENQMIKMPSTHARASKKVLVVLEGKLIHSEKKTMIEPGRYVVAAESDINQHMRALEQSKLLIITSLTNNQPHQSIHNSVGKAIANRILAGEPIEVQLIEALVETLKKHDPFEGDLFNQYADLFLNIFSELPLEPLKLSKTYCARLCAKWVVNELNVNQSINQAIHFIANVYQDVFLPHVKSTLVKEAVYWTLYNNGQKKTVQYIAECLFMNRTHLSERFKQLAGISLSNYILRVKMYGAMLLLIDDTLSPSDILEILGYKDDSHFIKMFKEFVGITPNEFRKRYFFHKMND